MAATIYAGFVRPGAFVRGRPGVSRQKGGTMSDRRIDRRRALAGGAGLTAALAAGWRATTAQEATPVAPPAGGSVADKVAAIDAFAEAALEEYGVPGAAVALVVDGKIVLARGYGVRTEGQPEPVDADTVFQLASVTKTLTAAALGTVVDAGQLGWDDPVVEFVPNFALADPYPTRWTTTRDLLAHRTGLPAFTGDVIGVLGYDRAEVMRRVRFFTPAWSFREEDGYSNIGYFVAGQVLAEKTGMPWEDALAERILGPVGMTRSAPNLHGAPADGNISANHALVDGAVAVVPPDPNFVLGAGGSAISTAHDLGRFMEMLLGGGAIDGRPVLTPGTVAEMFAPSMVAAPSFTELPPIDDQSGFAYGLGWGLYHDRGYQVMEKGGALAGIRSIVELVPELNLGVAVVANMNVTVLPEAIRAFVLEQFIGQTDPDVQETIRQAGAGILGMFQAPTPPADAGPPSRPLDAYAGTYANDLYGQVEIVRDGDGFRLEAGPARYAIRLTPFAFDTFLLDQGTATTVPLPATFTIGPDGTAVALETNLFGRLDRVEAS